MSFTSQIIGIYKIYRAARSYIGLSALIQFWVNQLQFDQEGPLKFKIMPLLLNKKFV